MLVCGDLIQSVCLDFDVSPEQFYFLSVSVFTNPGWKESVYEVTVYV